MARIVEKGQPAPIRTAQIPFSMVRWWHFQHRTDLVPLQPKKFADFGVIIQLAALILVYVLVENACVVCPDTTVLVGPHQMLQSC